MQRTTIDADDDLPIWYLTAGDPLVDDVLAWERLGVGARCETWLGWSTTLWSPVVVKLTRPHQRSHPRARRSLAREVAALQDNPHPALPRLVAGGLDAAVPHIVIEYVDGDSLDVVTEQAPLDWQSTAMLGIQLLSAVTSLHRRGIAHLDIKPENIVVRDGRPTLVDFGSARPLGRPQPAGRPVGTVGYSAPEMEACQPISTTMDVYGIGATLREAVTGFSAYDNDPVTRAHASMPVSAPAHPGVAGVINAMIAESVADRLTMPVALDALAGLFEADRRPWPTWLTAIGRSDHPAA